MRALIADADAGRRDALASELRRHGYESHESASVAGAPALARELDAQLVCVGGAGAVDACRELAADDRLVVLVAGPGELSPLDALTAGAADFWQVESGLGLRVQLAQQFARLQAESGEYALVRQALDLAGTGFVLTDPRLDDHPIVYANRAFLQITGYTAREVLGRNCRFLQGPESRPEAVAELRRGEREQRSVTVEVLNYRKDGTPFWNRVHISPVRDGRGNVVRFVGVQVDVTAHRAPRVAAEAAQLRSSFLAEASPLLDSTLDLRSTLDALSRLSVPFLGDVCVVDEIRHDEVRRLAAAAADPVVERLVRALPSAYPATPGDPLVRVAQTTRPEILEHAAIFGPDAPARLGGHGIAVPLKARGRIIGVLAFASLERGRRYGADDLLLAEDLARRAALALDNARLYENLGAIARTLQEGLLPARLPAIARVELAARFRPAGDGSVIGGDFYDALPRPDGVDLVIGDVTGKGARAAGLTGLVRHTLRTAASYEASPSEILHVVNRTLMAERGEGGGRYCTVALCRVTFNSRARATLCCAGHPMPMVVRGTGRVEPVGRPGSVLGWVEDPKLLDTEFELDAGESLVLYTDGVTEARTTGDVYGSAGLEELLRAAAGEDAAGIAARVDRAAAHAGARRDDVAVLVGRVRP
jgi:PAS domain S-box-containing protein